MPIILNAHGRKDYNTLVLASSPILYYEMDESSGNLADSSGNGFTGTVAGTPTYSEDGLIFQGTCIDFDRATDYFSFNPTAMAYSSGTVEFWVQGDYDNGPSSVEPVISITQSTTANNNCAIWFYEGVLQYNYRLNTGTPNTNYWRVQSDFSFVDGVKYHIAVVSGSPSPTFYVNGVATGKSTDIGIPSGQWFGGIGLEDGAHVGRFLTSIVDYRFHGKLDEVVHYDTQLSAQTILDHYNAGA